MILRALPELNSPVPDLDQAMPDSDQALRDLDRALPDLDRAMADLNPAMPGVNHPVPELRHPPAELVRRLAEFVSGRGLVFTVSKPRNPEQGPSGICVFPRGKRTGSGLFCPNARARLMFRAFSLSNPHVSRMSGCVIRRDAGVSRSNAVVSLRDPRA